MNLFLLLSFSLGIALGQQGVFFILIIGAVILGAFLFFKNLQWMLYGALLLCAFFVGSFRMWLAEDRFVNVSLPEKNEIVATVKMVDERAASTLIYARPEGSRVHVLVRSYEKISALPGDIIRSTGTIELPEVFVTDTNRIFDYPNYLKSKHTAFTQTAKTVEVVQKGDPGMLRFFAKLNRDTGELLARAVPYPVDGIVGGMVLGDRGSIPDAVNDLFQKTGTLHLLVLSGANITLLIVFLGVLFRRVPFHVKTVLLALGIVSLVLLSGVGIAAIRAGVMGLIVLLGTVVGRQYAALRALGVTFILLLLWNPYLLLFDPGFQLSFLATLCMITVVPKAEPLFKKVPKTMLRLPLRETLAITVTVSLFMLPFIAYFSGEVSFFTIPANIVAAFFVPAITFLGIGTIFVSALIPVVGNVLGIVLGFFGNILLFMLEQSARIPQLTFPPFSWWYIAAMYGTLFAVLFWREIKNFSFREVVHKL